MSKIEGEIVNFLKLLKASSVKRAMRNACCVALVLLLGLGLFPAVMLHISSAQASSDNQVMQAVLLIKQSAETSDPVMFPVTVAMDMNISYTVFNADLNALTNATLYDGQVGRFSLIAVTSAAMTFSLNSTQRALLDSYEERFGVAEALIGPVSFPLMSRYGVSSLGASPRFNSLRWTSNGLTNFMNTSMYRTTLAANTTVYAYGGNNTQTNPVLWSYRSGNIVRVASSVESLSPFDGDKVSSWATFWLASKLSSANKILNFYWSIDLTDVDYQYSDSGIYGAPPVSDLYFNGSDVDYMIANFLAQSGFNPTLGIEHYDVNNISMVTSFPALYSALLSNQNEFDFTSFTHALGGSTTYDEALGIIQADRNAISSWGFEPTFYFMVPGSGEYTNVTAPAITASPVWSVGQWYSSTSDTVPYLQQKLDEFDVYSPTLFRVAMSGWIPWDVRTTAQMLNYSGQSSWNQFWDYYLQDILYAYPRYWGGYRIEQTSYPNWVYGRDGANAPALQLLENITSIGVLPIVPSRTWALAENLYFTRNYAFNATYDETQNTLTYNISKSNPAARDTAALILPGEVSPVNFEPLMLQYDQNSTTVMFNYQSSITLKLGQRETTNPYVANYQTSLLTNSSLTAGNFSCSISAPVGTTSTTEIYAGIRDAPAEALVNGVPISEGVNWVYNPVSNLVTVTWTHTSEDAEIVLVWTGYTLSVNTVGSGSVARNNTGPYYKGYHVLLTANPNPYWSFDHWEGDLTGSVNPAVLTITGNMSVTAVFTINKFNLTVGVSGHGTTNATGTFLPDALTNVTVLATPDQGYALDYWSLNGTNVGSQNPYTLNMTANYNLVAVFSAVMRSLTVSVTGQGVTNATGTSYYLEFTNVTVMATPNPGWTFDHWVLDSSPVGSMNPFTVNMTIDEYLTAVFVPVQLSLTVSTNGNGATNATGTFSYNEYSNVTVLATPDAGNYFAYWTLNGTNVGSNNPYTLNMTSNYNLTAVFLPIQYELSVGVVGNGVTNATGTQTYNAFTNVSVLATPDSGYFLSEWLLNGTSEGSVNPYTLSMTANYNLTAVFAPVQVSLTVDVSGHGITNATGTSAYDEFSNVTILATPDSRYYLLEWLLNGTGIGSSNPYTLNMTANYNLTAVFMPLQFDLAVSVSGQGSTNVSGTFAYNEFTNVTVYATPDSGYFLDYWTLNGTSVGSNNPFTLNMTANYELTAVFSVVLRNLTVSAAGKGVTNVTGTQSYAEFTNVTVLATPNSGSFLNYWLLNGTNMGSDNPYTLNMTGNFNLTAVFSAYQESLTVGVIGSGITNATGTSTYDEFSNVTVLATPDLGYALSGWLLNGTGAGSANPYTLNMTGNFNLTAVFTRVYHNLSVYVVGHGITNATGSVGYPAYSNVSVLATPDSGYFLSEWLLNGLNVGSANPYTVYVTQNYNLTAVFAPVQYSLTVGVSGHGITNATGTSEHDEFTLVQVLATPSADYVLNYWLLNGTNMGSANPYRVNMTANLNLTAVFTLVQFGLTVNVSGDGNTNATGTSAYGAFTNVTILATPEAGSYFDHWLLNGTNVGSSNPFTLNMTGNFVLTAVFSTIVPEFNPATLLIVMFAVSAALALVVRKKRQAGQK